MKPATSKYYPLKVWASSMFIAPLVSIVVCLVFDLFLKYKPSVSSQVEFIMLVGAFGLLYSLPTLLVYYLTFLVSSKLIEKVIRIKLLCLIVAVAGMWLTPYFAFGGDLYSSYAIKGMFVVYTILIVFFTFRFRVYKQAVEECC